jgi:hypothetical protein
VTVGNPRDDLCGYIDRQGSRGVTLTEAFRALGGDQRQIIAAWNVLSGAGRIVYTGQYRQAGDATERVYVTGPDTQAVIEDRYSSGQPRDKHGRWTSTGHGAAADDGGSGGGGSGTGGDAPGAPNAAGAESLIQSIHDTGGFTYDPRTGGLVKVGTVKGVAVAVPHTEQIVGMGAQVNREEFIGGVADVIQKHGEAMANGAFLGGWFSEERGAYMVELTELIPDRTKAIALGKARNQEGVFDLGTGDYIDTGGTGG